MTTHRPEWARRHYGQEFRNHPIQSLVELLDWMTKTSWRDGTAVLSRRSKGENWWVSRSIDQNYSVTGGAKEVLPEVAEEAVSEHYVKGKPEWGYTSKDDFILNHYGEQYVEEAWARWQEVSDYDEALAWLRQLDTEIYDHKVHPYCGPTKRRLTEQELAKVMNIVEAHGLPTTLHNLNTSIGMQVYEKPLEATYPGISKSALRPEPVLALAAANLPLSEARKSLDRILWDDGWRVFSKMTHTAKNTELCRACGLEEPKAAGHYAY